MADLSAQAIEAAAFWGGLAMLPRLIGARENAVFEVTLNAGPRAALRLHRQGYQTQRAIEAELLWTEALANDGFPCPRPLRSEVDRLVEMLPTGQAVSLVSWIDAAPIGAGDTPLDGTVSEQVSLYEKLGALTARLHETTDRLAIDTLNRPHWDLEGLLGEAPLWGRFWENPALVPAEVDLLQQARRNAAQQLRNINNLDIGLIHADLIRENVLTNADGMHLIDFDDSGHGYRLYDLGAALIQYVGSDRIETLTRAICDGYGCSSDLMPLFIMLRGLASCGWVIPRLPPDDRRQRIYAERALICTRRYLEYVG